MGTYNRQRYKVSESFERILRGENPWVALGNSLDDWRRSNHDDRLMLVLQPLKDASTLDELHWAALFAATVEQLCSQENLPPPSWMAAPRYYLSEPWYPEVKTEKLRCLQEETTPDIFKRHNVFGGDRLLYRV